MTLKCKVEDGLAAIVIFTYLKPFNASLIPSLNMMYSILKIVATMGLLIYLFKKRFSISKSSKWCMAFLAWWTISIVLNGNLINNIQVLLSIFGMLLLFNVMQSRTNGFVIIAKHLRQIAEVYLILQLYTIIVDHPIFAKASVSFDKYFLGSDNYSAFIIIPLVGFILTDTAMHKSTLGFKTWFFVVVGFLCLAIPQSWAGAIAYGILIVLLIFKNSPTVRKIANVRNVCVLGVGVLVLVMVFHIQNYIGDILNAMGKVGMSSREIIWPRAVVALLKRPLTGYGILTEDQISSYILYGASHTHNIILEFFFSSGIVGFYLVSMWIKSALTIKKEYLKVKSVIYLLYCIIVYFICAFFDFYMSLIYFWTLIMCFDGLKITLQREGM